MQSARKMLAASSKWALSNDVRGKIVQEEINASKEKGSKKEEALSERERSRCKGLERPLEENLSRGFLFAAQVIVVEQAGSC